MAEKLETVYLSKRNQNEMSVDDLERDLELYSKVVDEKGEVRLALWYDE